MQEVLLTSKFNLAAAQGIISTCFNKYLINFCLSEKTGSFLKRLPGFEIAWIETTCLSEVVLF